MNTITELKEFLLNPLDGKAETIVSAAAEKPELAEWLYRLCLMNVHPASWRAAWLLVHINKNFPELIKPYTNRMIEDLPTLKIDRQKVSFFQILSTHEFCIDNAGELFDIALNNLTTAGKQMYVHHASLLFLEHFVKLEPLLAPELIAVLDNENNLPANHSISLVLKRINKTLKKIKSL